MKKITLILIIFNFCIESGFGHQCEGGIELSKKSNESSRDWVRTYQKIFNKYKSKKERISSLNDFFYEKNTKAKKCITFDDLQKLKVKIHEVFPIPKADKEVADFIGAIDYIAKKNEYGDNSAKPMTDLKKSSSFKNYTGQKNMSDSNTEIDSSNNTSSGTNEITDEKEKQQPINIWKWLFWCVLIVSIVSILWMKWSYFPKEMKFKDNLHKQVMQSQTESYNRIIDGLESRHRENKNAITEEKSTFELPKSVVEQIPEVIKVAINEPIKPQEKLKQFYLSTPTPTPDGLGSFRDMRLNQPNPNSSFYLFELDKNDENKATFSFLDNPNTVQNAIAYPDTNLIPACNYKNFNSKAKRIITESKYKGIATKDGEIWKVIKKAEIRFE